MLVDTGASTSVFPRSKLTTGQHVPTRNHLVGAGGAKIQCYGSRMIPLQFQRRRYTWDFEVADVTKPILGADFLTAHNLVVDVGGACLTSNEYPNLNLPCSLHTLRTSGEYSINRIQRILEHEFPDVAGLQEFESPPPASRIYHSVDTADAPPLHCKVRPLNEEKLAAAKAAFADMEAAGVIRRSNSPWSSPLHMVRKKNGGWRPCGDYRRLNDITIPDRYPIPLITDAQTILAGKKVFSVIDLKSGYNQVPMDPSAVPKTAVITPFGLWEWLQMPFGLMNSGCTFQRVIHEVLRDLPFIFVYIDDILIASESTEEHELHLREVFARLRTHHLTVNLEKCVLNQPQVNFLGHVVNDQGIRPLPEKVAAIQQFPPPTTKLDVQRLLGMANFYRRFLPRLAHIIRPLTNSLSFTTKEFTVTAEMISAVSQLKTSIANATMLVHPVRNATLSITTDASDVAIAGVLHQHHRGRLEPLSFFSRRLSDAETRYSTFDRELLAVFASVMKFRHIIDGRRLIIYTDHKPLTTSITKPSSTSTWPARAERQLLLISQFTTDIRHVEGEANKVADALSRPPAIPKLPAEPDYTDEFDNNFPTLPPPASALLPSTPPPPPSAPPAPSSPTSRGRAEVIEGAAGSSATRPSYSGVGDVRQISDLLLSAAEADTEIAAFEAAQLKEDDSSKLRQFRGFKLQRVLFKDTFLLCDMSTGTPRPVVPPSYRRRVFDAAHGLSHAGTRATRRMIARRWVWQSMQTDISRWCRECTPCQTSKVHKHTVPELQEIPVPTRRFTEINLDLVGPLPTSMENRYLLTIIDRNTRWFEVACLPDINGMTVVNAFLNTWISRYGVPVTVTTDRGTQFTGDVWSRMCSQLHIDHQTTTAYHPQSNGIIERFHRTLKAALRAKCQSANWARELPLILLGLRSAPRETDAISCFERTFGVPPILPGDFWSSAEVPNPEFLTDFQRILESSVPPRTRPNRTVTPAVPDQLASCKFVFVRVDSSGRPPLAPLYTGPFLVLERNHSTFKIQVGTRTDVINISRLKPAFTPEDAVPALPPKRGRPPKPSTPQPTPRKRGRPPGTTAATKHLRSSAPSTTPSSTPSSTSRRTRSGRVYTCLPWYTVWGGSL